MVALWIGLASLGRPPRPGIPSGSAKIAQFLMINARTYTVKRGTASSHQRESRRVDRLLTTDEVAALVRRPVATVRYWRHAGVGPRSALVRGRVLYREGDVEEWITGQFDADPAAVKAVGR